MGQVSKHSWREDRATARTYAIDESRPEEGSSRKSSDGIVRSSHAMQRRFLSPPEIPRLAALDESPT